MNIKRLVYTAIAACMMFTMTANAQGIQDKIVDDTVLIGMPDYGWTSFIVNGSLVEQFSYNGTQSKTYSSRSYYVGVQASRSDSGINLTVPVAGHLNSGGSYVTKFSWQNATVILPGDIYAYQYKTNSKSVTYALGNGYYSRVTMMLSAVGCINQYNNELSISLS